MAALCPGVQYGLSSQENFGGNKDLIFVKLTDSAFRAIEEYLKNQNKFSTNQNPTIKFVGNDGQLSFPSFHNGYTSFKFSMSSTADMEGPGGSFECVQQVGPPRGSLEALGVVPHKIRIHANDDVYEATRHRMTVAEEIHKNKCTREIKPNQTDIGRKVKVKQTFARTTPVPPTRREAVAPPAPPPPLRDSPTKMSFSPNMTSKLTAPTNNSVTNNMGSNQLNSSSRMQNKPSMPDIARRPIKERLIHLLAVRPFKKPELYERLLREGLREKKSMTSILKQIASLRDNAYHLNRAMWIEVRDDWPFYTESDRVLLKRRKPQNLTPPGGSDGGSSGSGQSPTSTHPGSPPLVSSSKRPGYYDGVDGLPTKRPRISHYRKPSEPSYRPPVENVSQRKPVMDSRDTSNMNPRSREREPVSNGYSNVITNGTPPAVDKHSLSDDDEGAGNVHRKRPCDNLSFGVGREKMLNNGSLSPPFKEDIWTKDDVPDKSRGTVCNEVLGNDRIKQNGMLSNGNKPKDKSWMMTEANDRDRITQNDTRLNGRMKQNDVRDQNRCNNIVTSTTQNSPDSPTEQMSVVDSTPPIVDSTVDSEFPDYLTEYTIIRNSEQRRRYKADFNADYAEYRDLHAIVEKVSRRFAELEERLNQQITSSPKYKDIKKQIFREYQQNKQDMVHQKAKCRFQYLHDKLSHIKRLVLEYDQDPGSFGYASA